jgi:hypothetical protein
MTRLFRIAAALVTLLPASTGTQPPAAAPAPVTHVLATLTVRAETRDQIPRVMPQEVRDTVQLYLDGKIDQWYARRDGRGVVFILKAGSAADAKALTDALPLVKAGLASFDFVELTPLTPLRLLIASPAQGQAPR